MTSLNIIFNPNEKYVKVMTQYGCEIFSVFRYCDEVNVFKTFSSVLRLGQTSIFKTFHSGKRFLKIADSVSVFIRYM